MIISLLVLKMNMLVIFKMITEITVNHLNYKQTNAYFKEMFIIK